MLPLPAASLDALYVPSFQMAALPSSASPCPGHRGMRSHRRSLQELCPGLGWGELGAESTLSPAPALPVTAQILEMWWHFQPHFHAGERATGLNKPQIPAGLRFSESGAGFVLVFTSMLFYCTGNRFVHLGFFSPFWQK